MTKKVLIADDDGTIRMMVQSILEAEGFSVLAAEDGKQAVDMLGQDGLPAELSLIVLDVMMPGMNGLDVLTRIKLNGQTSSIPVIMLTAERTTDDIMAGYAQGADYYVTKPFTRQQLVYGVQMVLGKRPGRGLPK